MENVDLVKNLKRFRGNVICVHVEQIIFLIHVESPFSTGLPRLIFSAIVQLDSAFLRLPPFFIVERDS